MENKNYFRKLKDDKKGMELRYWLISIIMFSGLFALMVIAFHDAAGCNQGYCVEGVTNPEIEARYNKLAEETQRVESLQDTVEGEEGLKVFNALGTIFTASIGVLNAVLASIVFIPQVFSNFGSDFGIPSAVTSVFFGIVVAVLTVLIIFAVLNAIRR